MDNKTIFVRTTKGEDEAKSRTSHLPGDVKRALLMVDGSATFGEISKRAAPSMRDSLGEMMQELEKSGFIQDKTMEGKTPKTAVPPGMVVPTKMATPHKKQAVDNNSDELDFMSGFAASPPKATTAEAAKAEKLRAEAEEKSRKEIATEKIRAQREAEDILLKAEQEAARIREETARRAREEAETARLRAEQEARRVREELEAARLKIEHEAKLRLEAAARERQQAEAARFVAEQEARKAREELEAARLKAEQDTRRRLEATAREQQQAEAARVRAEQEAAQIHIEREAARLRAEQEAKARLEAAAQVHDAAGEQAALTAATALAGKKTDAFSFEAFKIDEPQGSAEPHKEHPPAQKASPAEAAPAAKPGTFAFDSFHVDESPRPAEPHKKQQPPQKASATQQPGDAAKTTQPADVRQPARQQVPPPAASEPAESQPSQEQIKREAQERIAAEQRIAAEAQAKQLADAQARVWAEAEQRALEVARANTERAAHQAEYSLADTRHVERPVPVARVRRKPFAWGRLVGFVFKLGVFLMVLMVGALFVVPYVLPMRDYMPKVQQLLSEKLHQPVHLGYFSGRILPTPRLELGEIYIGEVKQFQAGQAQINFSIPGLFGDKKPINSVEFQDVKISGAGLQNATVWLQQLANIDQYPVSRMVINQGTLDADAFQLTGVEGELNFSPAGKFTQAKLRANAGKFTLGINAAPENKLQVAITVRDNALPLLPNWPFDELNAKGELSSDELLISDFDARILGGVVQGNASINWHSGWRAQGALSAKTITMQKLNKLLDGNVEGSARFKMTSLDLAGLTDSVVLEGSFIANDGMISGMDIVETARMRSKVNLPGGRTHFDGLSGVILYANNAYHFKQVKVTAGVLNATAAFDVNKQQLSGKMNVSLSMHEGTAPVDLQMGGAIDSPTLHYAP